MNYNIISTGSQGNAIVLNNIILLDCGVPFRDLKDVYKGLKIVLLTHIHGDHFNKTTKIFPKFFRANCPTCRVPKIGGCGGGDIGGGIPPP